MVPGKLHDAVPLRLTTLQRIEVTRLFRPAVEYAVLLMDDVTLWFQEKACCACRYSCAVRLSVPANDIRSASEAR
jgi:hypothetical protein